MAINTYRFWMATDANRLLANQNAFIQAAAPAFYQGNVAQLELHIVASSGVGTAPVEVPFPAGAEISVAVGDTNTYPTGGTWELSVDGVETEPMPYNATTAQVASALNALPSVSSAGGVGVYKTGDGYTITWNTYGLKPTIGIGSDTLTPSSYESISLVQAGSAENRQIVFVELRQNPIALGVDWTPLPTPSVTVSEVQAWNGTNKIYRVSITPQPKAGTITIAYGTKTATLAYNASPALITSALSPAQAFATGQYQWDIAIAEDSVLTASGSLVGYNGYSGSVNFATSESHQFLAGAERRATILEVSMSVDDKRYTLIQTPCNIFANVVSDGVLVPLPLGVALSEQVANARFVRRDVDQNPDASTLDVIWQNLGVDTLGSDVAGALNGADSPSAANPFATISDIPTVTQAEWGNIIGTLANQTDLAGELNFLNTTKYDVSNPAGYIDGSYLFGYATESWVQSQDYLTTAVLNGYAELSGATFTGGVSFTWSLGFQNNGYLDVSGVDSDGRSRIRFGPFSGGASYIAWGDLSFNGTNLIYGNGQNLPEIVANRSWVTSQNYITSSALTPYATKASPTFSGDVTLSNPIQSSGKLSVVATGVNNYTSELTHSMIRIGFVDFQSSFGYITNSEVKVGSDGSGNIKLSTSSTAGYEPYVIIQNIMSGRVTRIQDGKFLVNENQGNPDYEPYASSSLLALKANIAGDTFTGKVNFTPVGGASGLNVGIGGTNTASNTPGDLWIATGGANLNFRDGTGAWKVLASLQNGNVYSAVQAVDVSSTSAALRVTQRGTGNAIEVEDSTTPDATRFVVDQFGKVGVGTAPDATAAIKLDGNGISFNGLVFNPTATAAHTGGTDTLDLLVTINGVNYRLGLRPA